MSRLLIKLIGLILLFLGLYFFGQNIIFVSGYYSFFYRSLPATGSVLAIMSGIFALIFFPRETGNFGWILLGIGIVLVFLSGGVILRPTSLWSFAVAFTAMSLGFKLLNQGRINL
ncbi:hypothetical protein NIES2109_49910 [Nostoc sp. HK-01]|uniref:Uncharacterized protein n=2 Tax=Nostocales TaxID=1161 RepID=A0A1Z4GNX3_9CYAN|nr:hypothetical protein [Nostoc cycadae]BAY19189.1 hypothetical protein NIES21_50490 [Anabaenopsis circularis NIES-21]BBD62153.1 hypothetical protein NIES2109_49910 [Nostoc sp. HK-01]GBE92708.1 FHA domain-containing protein [Nostoc cycadae WK-1]